MNAARRFPLLCLVLSGLGFVAAGCGDGAAAPESPATIEATVLADGAVLSEVTVRLLAAGGQDLAGSGGHELAAVVTGTDGTARFRDLEPGPYAVEVLVPFGYEVAQGGLDRKPVTAPAGRTTTVSFILTRPVTGGTVEVLLTYPGLAFSPSDLTIGRNTTVVWRNAADMYHTITPDGHSEWERATVERLDETFSHTFRTPGTFPYLCEPHAPMIGTITVR
jgi:plastocyanin